MPLSSRTAKTLRKMQSGTPATLQFSFLVSLSLSLSISIYLSIYLVTTLSLSLSQALSFKLSLSSSFSMLVILFQSSSLPVVQSFSLRDQKTSSTIPWRVLNFGHSTFALLVMSTPPSQFLRLGLSSTGNDCVISIGSKRPSLEIHNNRPTRRTKNKQTKTLFLFCFMRNFLFLLVRHCLSPSSTSYRPVDQSTAMMEHVSSVTVMFQVYKYLSLPNVRESERLHQCRTDFVETPDKGVRHDWTDNN